MPLAKIISGGQTGVDRAALDVALALGLPCGGWCPKGRRAEDGMIDPRYPLQETPSADYAQRTEWNVRDADGVLLMCDGRPTGGTALALKCCRQYRRPYVIIDLQPPPDAQVFVRWLEEHNIAILGVGGPRESHRPGVVYTRASAILRVLFAADEAISQ